MKNKDKVKEKIKNLDLMMKVAVGLIILNIIYIMVGSILVSITGKYFFTNEIFSRGLIISGVINIIYIVFLSLNKRYRKNIVHLFMALILVFGIISAIFAREKIIAALWGTNGRYEGLFVIFYYFSLMFLTSFIDKKYKKIIINFILIAGLIHAIYAIYQKIYLIDFENAKAMGEKIANPLKIKWINGFTTNPNFLGSFLLICLLYSLSLFTDENKKFKCTIYMICSIIYTFVLLINNTQSCILGFILTFFVLLVYSIKKKKFAKIFLIIIMIVSVTTIVTNMKWSKVISHLIKTGNEASQVAQGNMDDSFGSRRLEVWKKTIQVVPNHLLHGVGIDDFYHVFGNKPLIIEYNNKNWVYDKAHNEYLQTLVTEGIFCLTSFLIMYAIIVIRGLKYGFKNKEIYLVLPIIGYLIQAFFNISVIEVAPIFYMTLGLGMIYKEKNEKETKKQNKLMKKDKKEKVKEKKDII